MRKGKKNQRWAWRHHNQKSLERFMRPARRWFLDRKMSDLFSLFSCGKAKQHDACEAKLVPPRSWPSVPCASLAVPVSRFPFPFLIKVESGFREERRCVQLRGERVHENAENASPFDGNPRSNNTYVLSLISSFKPCHNYVVGNVWYWQYL